VPTPSCPPLAKNEAGFYITGFPMQNRPVGVGRSDKRFHEQGSEPRRFSVLESRSVCPACLLDVGTGYRSIIM
jgi:hypothetical protein